jgi:hypothetical protein
VFACLFLGCESRSNAPIEPGTSIKPIQSKPIVSAPLPKADNPGGSPEERTFAVKFLTFLDYCDGTARLLDDCETSMLPERVRKTIELYAAIPLPVDRAPWTSAALKASRQLQAGISADWIDDSVAS